MFGLSTMHPLGLLGAMLHVVCHSLVKDTLFMGAGAVISQDRRNAGGCTRWHWQADAGHHVVLRNRKRGADGYSAGAGLFQQVVSGAGCLAMTGVASLLSWFAPVVLLLCALLTAGYLLPIGLRGFFPGRNADGSLKFFEKMRAHPRDAHSHGGADDAVSWWRACSRRGCRPSCRSWLPHCCKGGSEYDASVFLPSCCPWWAAR